MSDILKLARIQLLVIVVFALFKFSRPYVLENSSSSIIHTLFLSFPNFCEGIIGVLTLTMIGLHINRKFKKENTMVYWLATIVAAVYVFTQELKIHNLGGNNVYDPFDMIFSLVGLAVGYTIVRSIKPVLE